MEGWRAGGLEGWRAGGLEGWRAGGLPAGGLEGLILEGWRAGGLEGWRAGGLEGGESKGLVRLNKKCFQDSRLKSTFLNTSAWLRNVPDSGGPSNLSYHKF